ncbi:hypothetical protein N7455_007761 [Penicillium solitum]|uniref:uncharacterized protein n=1 Tax=Penicillium solitum TaxID=60172 RepID=UPI0032C42395|nr:hypothetical protein N7536_012284 [Penicillium majusculum]KAJ5856867.1 hypothetical protein N7455_007761 [Penicillium solitum]
MNGGLWVLGLHITTTHASWPVRIVVWCHDTHYIYRSLDYLSVILRYSGLFGLVCNSPVQGLVVTWVILLFVSVMSLTLSCTVPCSLTDERTS